MYGRTAKLVDHLHLPVQHGSDRILAAMKRGYTALEYKSTVRKLRAVRPDIAISSDFIVGFPGETDDDFRADDGAGRRRRLRLQLQLPVQRRPGTPAAAARRRQPLDVKAAPCSVLQAVIEAQGDAISAGPRRFGQKILLEGHSRKDDHELMGRTGATASSIWMPPATASGELVDVRISEVRGHPLRGELVG